MSKFALKWLYLSAFLGLSGTIALEHCLNLREGALGYSNSIWPVFLWLAWSFAISRVMTGVHREKIINRLSSCFGFSLLFVGSMTAGVQLEQHGMVDFSDLWLYVATLAVAAALTPLVSWTVCALEAFSEGHVPTKKILGKTMSDQRFFILVWGGYLFAILLF